MDTYMKEFRSYFANPQKKAFQAQISTNQKNKPVHCTVCPPVSDTLLTSLKQISLERGGFIECTQIRNHIKKSTDVDCVALKGGSLSQGRMYNKSAELAFVGFNLYNDHNNNLLFHRQISQISLTMLITQKLDVIEKNWLQIWIQHPKITPKSF